MLRGTICRLFLRLILDKLLYFTKVVLLRPRTLVNFKKESACRSKICTLSVQPNVSCLTTILAAAWVCPLQIKRLCCSFTVGSTALYPLVALNVLYESSFKML